MKTNYKFRAECSFDAHAIRTTLLPWIHDWTETRDNLVYEGKEFAMPDVVVEFSVVDGGPSYGEILWLIDGIDNCHIAGDTLAKTDDFTGERAMRDAFDTQAIKPRNELFDAIKNGVRKHQHVLRIELQRVMQQYATYESVRKFGNPSEGNSPGWLVGVSHSETGLLRMVRVAGRLQGKKLPNGDKPVKERMAVIAA